MNENHQPAESPTPEARDVPVAEPASARQPVSGWQRTKLVFRMIEVRLRFVAVVVGIGLLMAYWGTIENYWDRWTRPDPSAAAHEEGTEYYCPMHPNIVRPGLEPNGAIPNCPVCGMPLSKRKTGEAVKLPPGVIARVQLSPERVQLAGIKTAEARYMPLAKEVRTVGYVEYDQSRLSRIVARASGYLEKLYVDTIFAVVEEGEPLADVYSPELYSSIQELRLAKARNSSALVASARQRLRLLGIGNAEIDEALQAEGEQVRLLVRSPQSGHVIKKNVVVGAAVERGTVLFEVADLSSVWIEADVYERDLDVLHVGQEVEARVEAFPGKVFAGEIALVYPELNSQSRTNRVRVSLDNREHLLRPGMFATVHIKTPVSDTEPFRTQLVSQRAKPAVDDDEQLIALQRVCPVTGLKLGSMGAPVKAEVDSETVFLCCKGCEDPLQENSKEILERLAPPPEDAVLTVPESAVVDTGTQKVVYVEREPGVFEGVKVELGSRAGGYYPVLEGLLPGDRVAAAGAFLLDAETRLNPAAASAYFGASDSAPHIHGSSPGGATTQKANAVEQAPGLSPAHQKNIAKLPAEDQPLATAQAMCPVTEKPLGWMGMPAKILLQDQAVYLCCKSCEPEARKDPQKTLEKIKISHGEHPAPKQPAAPAAGHRH